MTKSKTWPNGLGTSEGRPIPWNIVFCPARTINSAEMTPNLRPSSPLLAVRPQSRGIPAPLLRPSRRPRAAAACRLPATVRTSWALSKNNECFIYCGLGPRLAKWGFNDRPIHAIIKDQAMPGDS